MNQYHQNHNKQTIGNLHQHQQLQQITIETLNKAYHPYEYESLFRIGLDVVEQTAF